MAARAEFNMAMRGERGSEKERRDERRNDDCGYRLTAVAVPPRWFSPLSSLDRGISHLSSQCHGESRRT